jgi:hypothetical protein
LASYGSLGFEQNKSKGRRDPIEVARVACFAKKQRALRDRSKSSLASRAVPSLACVDTAERAKGGAAGALRREKIAEKTVRIGSAATTVGTDGAVDGKRKADGQQETCVQIRCRVRNRGRWITIQGVAVIAIDKPRDGGPGESKKNQITATSIRRRTRKKRRASGVRCKKRWQRCKGEKREESVCE